MTIAKGKSPAPLNSWNPLREGHPNRKTLSFKVGVGERANHHIP